MTFVAKLFSELSAAELYEILKARSEIFLLEQGMHYQDMDDTDYRSLHCFLWENDTVVAYLRAFCPEKSQSTVRVGRVLTRCHGMGHGRELMEKSIIAIKEKMPCETVSLHSQSHAKGFYEKLGFLPTSAEFLEAGVRHVAMEKKYNKTY